MHALVCKGLPNNSCPVFFTKSQRMAVLVCKREWVWERFLPVYHTYTQVCLFSSFSLQRPSAVCMWLFQGVSMRLLIKAIVRRTSWARSGLAGTYYNFRQSCTCLILSCLLSIHLFSSFGDLFGLCLSDRFNSGFFYPVLSCPVADYRCMF